MKITVTTTSQTLKEAMWQTNFDILVSQKTNTIFQVNIQNLDTADIYIENWAAATVADWYKLTAWNEVQIVTKNLDQINLISNWTDATDVRIIWN